MHDHNADRVCAELNRYGMTRETYKALYRKPPFDQDLTAFAYVEWLLKRDRIEVPDDARPRAIWATHPKRICAVEFRRDGLRLLRVAIPHWDWEPTP